MRRWLAVAMAASALSAGLLITTASGHMQKDGGVFLIAGVPEAIDPAISLDAPDALGASCVKLMSYPDKPLPEGTRLVPEAARAYPAVSRDGRTYTFTLRDGFRFSTGEKVTAGSFAHAIDRILAPATKSPWAQYAQDIAGAQAVLKGKATHAAGVLVHGNTLVIRLTHATRDFPARVTAFPFCAVPADLPVSAEGVGAPFPGAGPYTITEFVAGKKLVLKRNPFYSGSRPHHVDEIDFVQSADPIKSVESGQADYAEAGSVSDFVGLDPKFRPQLHVAPAAFVSFVVLNSSQPLFKDNPALRQAVNFAVDRPALIRASGGSITGQATDQYLPPSMPGFRDAKIYPLTGPDVARAKSLAQGHTRAGKAALYVKDTPVDVSKAQIIQRDLKPLGITVTIKKLPGPALFQRLFTPGTPYDMTLLGYGPDYFDPYAMLNILFDGRLIGTPYSFNLSYFNSQQANTALATASRLVGAARYRAYGKLDVDLARNEAPSVAYENQSALSLVSKRVGCIVLNTFLDITSVCLK